MTSRQLFLPQPSSLRRQPLLKSQVSTSSARFAEVAGGTTAECAAVACCCPCGLVNLLVLVIYKVPAGLCRRVLKKRHRQRLLKKKGLLQQHQHQQQQLQLRHCKYSSCGCDGAEFNFHPVFETIPEMMSSSSLHHKLVDVDYEDDMSSDQEVVRLEKEMWDRFYSTGFWRSPSQREPSKALTGV